MEGAKTNNDATFAGTHKREADGTVFDVIWLPDGWYWWTVYDTIRVGPSSGPFPTAEGAYLSAIGE